MEPFQELIQSLHIEFSHGTKVALTCYNSHTNNIVQIFLVFYVFAHTFVQSLSFSTIFRRHSPRSLFIFSKLSSSPTPFLRFLSVPTISKCLAKIILTQRIQIIPGPLAIALGTGKPLTFFIV
jgi:hypothetical protein